LNETDSQIKNFKVEKGKIETSGVREIKVPASGLLKIDKRLK
jgi:hypothetical protein